MQSFLQGDIVSALFPYEEDDSIKKRRPCLVLGVSGDRLLAAKITTTELRSAWGYYLNQGTTDMAFGHLPYESWVNLNRRAWIPPEDVLSFIGTLSPLLVKDILAKIERLVN